ncbi:MAG: hypothetical protein EA369_08975 [Bradymonadales bacterium]|nr:MAG: hypothetical protein EA369_08975 [Bradymonadales bacterium]
MIKKTLSGLLQAGGCVLILFILASPIGFWSDQMTANYLKSEILKAEEGSIYPSFPVEDLRPEEIEIKVFKRLRGDFVLEFRRPPFRTQRWTINQYTKELIPWEGS